MNSIKKIEPDMQKFGALLLEWNDIRYLKSRLRVLRFKTFSQILQNKNVIKFLIKDRGMSVFIFRENKVLAIAEFGYLFIKNEFNFPLLPILCPVIIAVPCLPQQRY
ncbi:MAG: hypothetical protein ACNS64_04175, partial [Candidatus Halalkalibacterium sp. M3_1C_030]